MGRLDLRGFDWDVLTWDIFFTWDVLTLDVLTLQFFPMHSRGEGCV